MTYTRHVGFVATPTVSRMLSEHEFVAIHNFSVHASHCERCADPYMTHIQGKTLCDRGHQHACEVAKYVFNRAGRACSVTEWKDEQPVHVEIPVCYGATRGLLKAMERGLRLRRHKVKAAAPVVSYDRTYWIQRRQVERAPSPAVEVVEPARRGRHFEKIVYVEPRHQHRDFAAFRPNEKIVFMAAPRQHRTTRPFVYRDDPYFR